MSHGMHEFRIHHLVSELMNLLGANTPEKPGADTYTELLQKNMTPYITTQVSAHNAKKKIMESAGASSIEFLSKYDELKSRNVRDLDSLTYFLSRQCDDEMTKLHLKKHAEERAAASGVSLTKPVNVTSSLPEPGTKMTPDEFEKLRENLMKASSAPTITKTDAMKKALKERQTKNLNIPVQPDWIFQRPFLTMDFVPDRDGIDEPTIKLGNLPVDQQEDAVIEDLLFCMEGMLGKYITALPLTDRYAKLEFSINPSLDPSRKELVKRILPLCSNYSTVVRFIEEKSAFEYGLVNHALGSAMRTLIKDYLILVAQLENQFRKGQLTLLRLWFYIQPTMRVLEILASVANSVNKGECIGGAVLSLLHEKTASLVGDAKAQELCLFLTQYACVPYFEILERWIYKGVINDPYSEFLVEENEAFQKENLQEDYNDSYWEQHYTIRRERIPIFLEQVADKILNTGKYLNVVRQCGRDVKCPSAEEMVYTIKERQYCEQIENAYSYASKLLLNLLMEDYQLMDRLRSIKHYFLLDQGDFVVQFMDMSDEEMKKPMDEILITRLESLLELAQRTSTANVDPFKDDLKVELLPYDLISQLFKILSIETKREKDFKGNATDLHLSGLESFTFDYIVKWPVSLVLNRKALTRYQMLFRHLFYCKHVERQLCSVWLSNKTAKMYLLHSTRWYAAAFALRQRMLNFVQNFEYYMMVEVIEPNWHVFVTNMDSASNMDDVLNYHNDLLNNCLKDCMLTSPELLKIVHKLMMVCVTFSNFIQRLNQTTNVELEASKLTPTATLQAAPTQKDRKQDPEQKKNTAKAVLEHVDHLAGSENFERTIAKFDGNFSRFLIDLLDRIMDNSIQTYEVKFMNIVHRLNFNGFYRESLETLSAERSMMEARTSSANDRSRP